MPRFPRYGPGAICPLLAWLILAVFLASCTGDDASATNPGPGESVMSHVHLEPPKSRGERVRNGAITGQAVATIIAIGLGGAFAWRRGYLFRLGQPYVTIDHTITHRRVSN